MSDKLFSRAGVRYEVACDLIGALISHYSEEIGVENDKPMPNAALIAEADAKKSELRKLRDDLDPDDAAGIERVIEQYAPIARQFFK